MNVTGVAAPIMEMGFFESPAFGTILGLAGLMLVMYGMPKIIDIGKGLSMTSSLRKMAKYTGRNILVLAHHDSGLFGSMITCDDLIKIEKQIRKFKGKPFDFILNTLGGDVFASVKIAKLIKGYPGEVRMVIPKYAMSGGTMITLAGDKIMMNPQSTLGPVDPQLGSLFKMHSSRSWNEIVKKKGEKASDDAIAMSFTGNKVTKSITSFIRKMLTDKPIIKRDKFIRFLVEGDVEHSYQIGINDLKEYGLPVYKIPFDYADEIIETKKSGIFSHKVKGKHAK